MQIYPNDIRPMGTNNLNQLIHQNLGLSSFDVVSQVQGNLPWLKELFNNLHVLQALSVNREAINRIGQHSHVLYAIAESIPALKEIYCNLGQIVSAAQSYYSLAQENKKLHDKLDVLLGITSQEGLDHLLERYHDVELKLATAEAKLAQVNTNSEDIKIISKVLVHLNLSEAVTIAEKTHNYTDIAHAITLLQESKQLGNDEQYNEQRLGAIHG